MLMLPIDVYVMHNNIVFIVRLSPASRSQRQPYCRRNSWTKNLWNGVIRQYKQQPLIIFHFPSSRKPIKKLGTRAIYHSLGYQVVQGFFAGRIPRIRSRSSADELFVVAVEILLIRLICKSIFNPRADLIHFLSFPLSLSSAFVIRFSQNRNK